MSDPGSREPLQDAVDRLEGEVAQLRRSRRRLAEAADEDRRAFERALHDGVQQYLVAFAVDLQRLAGLVASDPAEANALLGEMVTNVREALDATTNLAHMVYPLLLDGRGLASVLRSAAENAGVTAVVEAPAGAGYAPEIAAAAYWFCVEALSSALSGSQARVSVVEGGGALTFEVTIDGQHSPAHLDRLRDRIEALDGGVRVDGGEDGGSRVQGWLPLAP